MIGTTAGPWSPALATPTSSAPDVQEGLRDFRHWSLATWLHWILWVAMLWCFVGHGAFGIIGKAGWLPYYHVFGIGDSLAWDTMPLIGAMDIAIGVVTLVRPMRAVILYGLVWTSLTALLRPMAGQGLWQEVAERGGNFGIPIALLVLVGFGTRDVRSWFELARPRPVTLDLAKVLSWSLRICIALLLIGHGGFGITNLHHKEWVGYLGALGFSPATVESMNLIPLVAWFEVALGVAVLVKPYRSLILGILVWKVGFELLRPLAGEPIWEFIERGGDYFLPLALFLVQGALARSAAEEGDVAPFPALGHARTFRAPPPGTTWAPVAPATVPAATTTATATVPATSGPAAPARPVVSAVAPDDEVLWAAAALAARMGSRRPVGSP